METNQFEEKSKLLKIVLDSYNTLTNDEQSYVIGVVEGMSFSKRASNKEKDKKYRG